MKTQASLLIALIVVLVILIIYHFRKWIKKHLGLEGFKGGSAQDMTGVHQPYVHSKHNPYMLLEKQLDEIRGYRNDGYNQPPFWRQPHGLDRYHRSGAHIKPEQIAEAEREQWFAAADRSTSGHFNTELTTDMAKDTFQAHETTPSIDYGSYITDLVVDPRTRDNHQRWVEEMKPWSGTAMKVDDLDMENYVDFVGLRRPQAVVQYNPLQLTEIDTYDLAKNKKFNFQG